MIAIIGAMSKEVASIIALLTDIRKTEMASRTFYEGTYGKHHIVACVAGIGKVNASVTTTLVCEHFKPSMVINLGVAGGASSVLKPLDIVVALKIGYHDVDLTSDVGSDIPHGQLPFMPRFFDTNKQFIDLLKLFHMEKRHIHFGTILTGDQFITSPSFLDNVVLKYYNDENVLAVDMESAAIAHVCHQFQLPFVCVRSISDVIGNVNQTKEYYDFVGEACLNATEITKHLLNNLEK